MFRYWGLCNDLKKGEIDNFTDCDITFLSDDFRGWFSEDQFCFLRKPATKAWDIRRRQNNNKVINLLALLKWEHVEGTLISRT